MSQEKTDENFRYFSLNPDCSLKYIEYGSVYDKKRDALYKLNDDALDFLLKHQNVPSSILDTSSDEVRKFTKYLLDEKIFLPTENPFPERSFLVSDEFRPSLPSLRYLLMHLTKDCNLRCRHCYVAPNTNEYLPYNTAEKVFAQMQEMQGLIILLSGGEPLVHPNFWDLNDTLPKYDLRFELLSNGTLITPETAKNLNVHHVQISIDGLEEAHDFMRGQGSYKKAINGIENLREAGKDVSISTMVYAKNINDFDAMEKLLDEYEISQWIINQPSAAGRWHENLDYSISIETAVKVMIRYGRGEGLHESKTNFTCGSHITTVMVNGNIYPCPFLSDEEMLMGTIDKTGLRDAWKNRKGITLSELAECEPCEFLEKCRGGCRYRAKEEGHVCGKDPVMCAIYKKEDIKMKTRINKKESMEIKK